jgi:hypothetical protein
MILTYDVHLALMLRMRGATPLPFVYAIMECTGKTPVCFSFNDRYQSFFLSFFLGTCGVTDYCV